MTDLLSRGFWDQLGEEVASWTIHSLPAVAVIIVLALLVQRITRRLLGRLKPRLVASITNREQSDSEEIAKRVDTLFGIVQAVVRIVVWGVALMLLLRNVGIDIAPILAGAGVVGLAVGFGAQELVRDVISGFFLLLENHVRTGDVVQVNGTGGLVESVGLRTIVLRDQSGTVHVFQNGKINSLSNMTKEWSAMVFDIAVAYSSDTDRVVEVMKEVAEELQQDAQLGSLIIEPLEVMGLDRFGENELVIRARLKTRPIKQWAVGREYRRRLKKAFDAAGIEIPFPQRTVWVRGEDKLPKAG